MHSCGRSVENQRPLFHVRQSRWFCDQKEPPKQQPSLRDLRRRPKVFNFSWKNASVSIGVGVVGLALVYYMKKKNEEEVEKRRRRTVGKTLIGGEWQLVNHFGELQSSADFAGRWTLIYFGFTHCPDICPDEIDKMCNVAKLLNERSNESVKPLFFTVDPLRDSVAAVKKYCQEFSPELLGFTGSVEQVRKVTRTFRVYFSEGPKDEDDDYIVDHSVIMYLVDPEGQFVDYYGQNRTVEEVVGGIMLKMAEYNRGKQKGWW